jgi:hypothetical protein
MLLKLSVELPVLVTVIFWAELVVPTVWLAKVRLVGFKVITAPVPVPVNETVCGLPGALSATESVPVRVPVAVGVNVTEILQFEPAASVVEQVFVCAKSPVREIPMPVNVDVPSLYSVTICAALVVPKF